jgi:hypothetical protein
MKRIVNLVTFVFLTGLTQSILADNITAIPLAQINGESVILLSGKGSGENGMLFPTIAIAKHHGYCPKENSLPALDEIFFAVTNDALRLQQTTDGFTIKPGHFVHGTQVAYVDAAQLSKATEGARLFLWFPTKQFLNLISGSAKEIVDITGKRKLSLKGGTESMRLHDSMPAIIKDKQVLAALQVTQNKK